MNCLDASQELLTADPAELTGHAPTELSRHIRDCSRCGTAAAAILSHTDTLRRAMNRSVPSQPPARALERARRLQQRRRRRLVAAPVLAAAGLATLLLTSDTASVGSEIGLPAQAARVASPLVEQPMGVDVAVFNTDDPNIVVVWFF
jgi:anti-sigma factor RsiW